MFIKQSDYKLRIKPLYLSELVTLILVSYLLVLGTSRTIIINEDILKIISLTPFFQSYTIKLKSIIKIKSKEIFDYQPDATLLVSVFHRTYHLEYFNEKDKKKEVIFSINNSKKEKEIMEVLQKNSLDERFK